MMNGSSRGAITVCAVLVAFAGAGRLGSAQTMAPAPAPPACARPNVAAATIHPVMPATPPLAERLGIGGTVQVVVTLDADSNVVGTRIQSTPSALLNQAAIAAARASTFRTEVRDCVPQGGEFMFTVDFENNVTFSTSSTGARTVTVIAEGTVTRAADVAFVEVRITTTGDTAAAAAAKSDRVLDAMKAKLLAFGITGTPITPTPLRAYRPTASNPSEGYMTARNVDIGTATVADAGRAANAAATIADVEVVGIHYELSDRASAQQDALRNALQNAKKSAAEAARGQHVGLGSLQQVVASPQNGRGPAPEVFVRFQRALDPRNPTGPAIQVPAVTVNASATVTYAIQP